MGAIEKQSLASESDAEPFDAASSGCCEDTSDQSEVVEVDAKTAKGGL